MKEARILGRPQLVFTPRPHDPVPGATLGLLGLLVMLTALFAGSAPENPDAPRPGRYSSVAVVRYVRSGQLAADARTARCMAHYLLEPEPEGVTNPCAARSSPISSSLPKNDSTLSTAPNREGAGPEISRP